MIQLPIAEVNWRQCYRIIPSRFPPVDLFADVAPPGEWDALNRIETLTNERVRQENGLVALVKDEDRVTGPGSSYIMAAFTHPDPSGDQFTDGSFGICYAAHTFDDALRFSIPRRESFFRATQHPPVDVQMRVLTMELAGLFHDIRDYSEIDLSVTAASRELVADLRKINSYGMIFGGPTTTLPHAVAVLRPSVLSKCTQERHLSYRWDGERISQVYDYSTGETTKL
jgi:hypothetical protein